MFEFVLCCSREKKELMRQIRKLPSHPLVCAGAGLDAGVSPPEPALSCSSSQESWPHCLAAEVSVSCEIA